MRRKAGATPADRLTRPRLSYRQSVTDLLGHVRFLRAIGETLMLEEGRRSYGQRMLDRGAPNGYVSHYKPSGHW